jgi:peptidoglycan pentaglycine glycine transferase (the first glycine)
MKPKGRYNIRVSRKHGVSIVEDNSEQGVADFLRIYETTAARQGTEAKLPGYFQALVALLTPLRRVSIFFAEHQGRRLATALVVYFGRKATYFFGGSLALHRHVMAPYLLHFEVMRQAKARGCEWYDFWGIAPGKQPDHPWHDITVFKRKFGGTELNLVPTLDYVYDPRAYERYTAAHGRAAARRPEHPEWSSQSTAVPNETHQGETMAA